MLKTRITPACAGKRTGLGGAARTAWNHPRVRGEESNENAALGDIAMSLKCKFSALFQEPPPSAA